MQFNNLGFPGFLDQPDFWPMRAESYRNPVLCVFHLLSSLWAVTPVLLIVSSKAQLFLSVSSFIITSLIVFQ